MAFLKGFVVCLSDMAVKFSEYRKNDIQRKLSIIGMQPLDVLFTGATGSGKSTTLNSLLQRNAAKIGFGAEPETMDISYHTVNDLFRIWDSPGLGDGVDIDKTHKKLISDLLKKKYQKDYFYYGFIDMVIVIVDASSRDMYTEFDLINNTILKHIQSDRVLIVLNKADFTMSGHHWNCSLNAPDKILLNTLENKCDSVRDRIKGSTGICVPRPVYYSAEYDYNVQHLFDFIIDNMPYTKREMK